MRAVHALARKHGVELRRGERRLVVVELPVVLDRRRRDRGRAHCDRQRLHTSGAAGDEGCTSYSAPCCLVPAAAVAKHASFEGTALAPPVAAPLFTLHDQAGHAISLAVERGHYVVVTFLYTHCPDVCPVIAGNAEPACSRRPWRAAPACACSR